MIISQVFERRVSFNISHDGCSIHPKIIASHRGFYRRTKDQSTLVSSRFEKKQRDDQAEVSNEVFD